MNEKILRHKEICDELNELYARKNHDYGDSFHTTFVEEGLAMARIRLGDKFSRFKTLSRLSCNDRDQQQVTDESIRDTLLDLANYAIMTVLEMDTPDESHATLYAYDKPIKKWLAEIGMKIKGNWQIFRVGFTPKVERAHQALPKKKQRHRRPRLPSALGYRFGHGYTILRKHNLFRLKQSLHLYYYRRDRNRVISFKRASGLISRLGQLRKCNHQQVLDRHYQPKTMFALKKVVRKECRRLQALYPPYQAA